MSVCNATPPSGNLSKYNPLLSNSRCNDITIFVSSSDGDLFSPRRHTGVSSLTVTSNTRTTCSSIRGARIVMNWRSLRRTRLIVPCAVEADSIFFRFRDATIFEKSSSPCARACGEGPEQHARPRSSDCAPRPGHRPSVEKMRKMPNDARRSKRMYIFSSASSLAFVWLRLPGPSFLESLTHGAPWSRGRSTVRPATPPPPNRALWPPPASQDGASG